LWYSGEYSSFSVGPETDNYRLHVSGFSGDAGDALANPVHPGRINNGMEFSTPDRDNDRNPFGKCNGRLNGWWFGWCTRSCLNLDRNNVCWNAVTDENIMDVRFARMLVKLD